MPVARGSASAGRADKDGPAVLGPPDGSIHGGDESPSGEPALGRSRGQPAHAPLARVLEMRLSMALVLVDLSCFGAALLVAGTAHPAFALLLLVLLGLNASGGYYRSRLTLSVLDELPGLAGRALVAGAVATSFKLVMDDRVGDRMLQTAALSALLTVFARTGLYSVVRRLRRRGQLSHPTLILGAGVVGGQVANILLEHPECGLRPVGFLDGDPLLAPEERPVPLLGGTAALARVLAEGDIRNVIVAYGATRESAVVDMLRTCDRLSCEIFLVPRLYEMQALGQEMDVAWGMPLVRLKRAPFRTSAWRLKRGFDATVAGFSLALLAPVLGLCALLVRLEGGPGVIFRQERVGLDGRPFTLLKFRSLAPATAEESASHWNVGSDSRLGPIGRMLRRTSLDELPQLWNILRGDMSLVGPRPERPYFVGLFDQQYPRYMARHRVPAGLTGWAQVHGLRGDTSISDRARFDNYYIENWSLWADVRILLRTVGQVARAGGR
jgi:exopolysaccharide biosynthesis polyprenyl glycosylphosphotransferase